MKRGDRGGPGDPVGRKASVGLEAPQRGDSVRTQVPVERAGGEAVPGEQELELSDVPAKGPTGECPAPEAMPPVAAERRARARTDDTVDRQPVPALERLHRSGRVRTRHAVDRPDVEQARLQRNLDRRHGGAAGGRGTSGREG